ncbi:MAG: DUF58 domain-containing protein [Candidatus Dormibacteria bacterium]
MVRVRPTRRLPGMLLAALVIYVFATNSQVIWLYLVSALIAGLALVGLVAPLLTVRRIRPTLSAHRRAGFSAPLPQDRARVFAGDRVTLEIELGEPRAPVEVVGLFEADHVPLAIGATRWSPTGLRVEFETPTRGVLQLSGMRLATSWPLGIARAERSVDLTLAIVVHPVYALPPQGRRPGAREPAGSSASRGAGEEFLGLREFRSGDSQRRVHWPTSARSGRLIVVETARESSNSNFYDLDLGDVPADAAELAVQVAASLVAGNIVAGAPMSIAIPGQSRALQRWPDVLAALARARPGDPRPGRTPHGAQGLSVDGAILRVRRGDKVVILSARTELQAALEALDAN